MRRPVPTGISSAAGETGRGHHLRGVRADAEPQRYLVLDGTRQADELAGAVRQRVAELVGESP